jgi:Acyl CoA:acetate/3-ketoacid CoA transferase, beta subunit
MLPVLDEEVIRHRIAKRIALDFEDGVVVNLGIGIPTLVSDYLPEDVHVLLQTENGVVGAGPKPEKEDLRFIGAGGRCVSLLPGSSLVASDMSFGLIRGGHLDATVLGALEVDSSGNLANWMIPGKDGCPGWEAPWTSSREPGPSTWPQPTATRKGARSW